MLDASSPDLLDRAARWDAAGDHARAIDELAGGCAAGDPQCARLLGLRLLIGDRAPLLPDAGLQFLGEACDGGLPEAASRAAGLLALGVRTAPDWTQALRWLVRAAVGGWQPAASQLLALCEDRALAERGRATSSVDWSAIAAAVPLHKWRTSPVRTLLVDEPRIALFPDFLRADIRELLISLALPRLAPALVYQAARGEEKEDPHRTNTVATFHVDAIEFVHALVQARIAAACNIDARWLEPPTVLHYAPGQQIRDHYDFVDPASTDDYAGEIARHGQRICTFIIYLNDEYDGGDTDFPRLGLRHRGTGGEAICFTNARADLSPELRMLHAGRPVLRGEKWILTQFIRSKAMR